MVEEKKAIYIEKDKVLKYLDAAYKEGKRILFTPAPLVHTIFDLLAKGFTKYAIVSTFDIVVITHYKHGISRVVEIVGLNTETPEIQEILTNLVFELDVISGKYEFFRRSCFLEQLMWKYILTKSQAIEKVFGNLEEVEQCIVEKCV